MTTPKGVFQDRLRSGLPEGGRCGHYRKAVSREEAQVQRREFLDARVLRVNDLEEELVRAYVRNPRKGR